MIQTSSISLETRGNHTQISAEILTPSALDFLIKLHLNFNARRLELLKRRRERQVAINHGEVPDFLESTAFIREGEWKAEAVPADIQDRRVEITGPVDRKMIINAMNSGAKVFMADFEDSNSPTWQNVIEGQINLRDAVQGTIQFSNEQGKTYQLKDKTAVLFVRPRGWHLDEKHLIVDGEAMSGALVDFGLFFFHNAAQLLKKGSAPYFYLPKMESHLEARLWNDVFCFAQEELGITRGTIKVTVLIETILAAFEMDEIIYELREHIAGLNAGRWDYIFSSIKKFAQFPDCIFPDRAMVTMSVPFMRAYCKLLVKTCHKRGIHAMGGMSAFIPTRKDEDVNKNAFMKVRTDKELEAQTGFDGTWVAHPDLVSVALEVFDKTFGDRENQKDEMFSQFYQIKGEDLTRFHIEGAKITEVGLRQNINVGILYIESWLMGTGAAALYNLMEDAATAEISRAQLWQWLRHEAKLEDGRVIQPTLIRQMIGEELVKIQDLMGTERYQKGRFGLATEIFEHLIFQEQFEEFLTLKAYQYI
jgi:malate synthase